MRAIGAKLWRLQGDGALGPRRQELFTDVASWRTTSLYHLECLAAFIPSK